MMIGENRRPHPTIHIPPGDSINDPTVTVSPHSPSPYLESFAPLFRYLPSNDSDSDESHLDSFRMYEFKVRRCTRGRSHDWTECPFAHPGEKARRRDPRKYHYSGTSCPEFRKGICRNGDSCEFSHGVFECWLHPDRYRTQPCKDGTSCRRRICFFAHTHEQLRSDLGGIPNFRNRFESRLSKLAISTSPTSILVSPTPESPPMSPSTGELIASMRKMQLSGGGWGSPMRSGLGLPFSSSLRSRSSWPGISEFDSGEEIPAMEVVESGKELRARMYARLSRENSLG